MSDILFIGGAPRTGTTLLHALISTSPRSNEYVAECSYLTGFMIPYYRAIEGWESHTQYYFSKIEEMKRLHADVLQLVAKNFRTYFGDPELLVLKDPLLTPGFHHLAELLPQAKFAVTIRDPRDAVLSRLEVMERSSGQKPRITDIDFACTQYNESYEGILHHWRHFQERLLLVPYQHLVSGQGMNRLSHLGIDDVRPDEIMNGPWATTSAREGDPWKTDLYGTQFSTASIGRYKKILDADTLKIITEKCGETARGLEIEL